MQNQYPYYNPRPPRKRWPNEIKWLLFCMGLFPLLILGFMAALFSLIAVPRSEANRVTVTAAPTPTPNLTPNTTRTGGIEKILSYNGFNFQVFKVEQAESFGTAKARPGYHLVALDMIFLGDHSFPELKYSQFSLRDGQGNLYKNLQDGRTPLLPTVSEEQYTGWKITGWLTFEVPEDATNLVLECFVNSTHSGLDRILFQVNVGDITGVASNTPTQAAK